MALNFLIYHGDKVKNTLIESGKDVYNRIIEENQEIFFLHQEKEGYLRKEDRNFLCYFSDKLSKW